MKASKKHLVLRGSNYHFVVRVPSDMSRFFPCQSIRHSLKTKDPKTAEQLAVEWSAKVVNAFNLLRSPAGLTTAQVDAIVESVNPKKSSSTKPQRPRRLSQFVNLYLKEKSPNLIDKSIEEYRAQFEVILSIVGDFDIDTFDRADFLRLRSKLLKRHLSCRTVNKYMGQLSTLFKWAIRHEYLRYNPAEGMLVSIRRKPDEERHPYSVDDIQLIVDTIDKFAGGDESWKRWVPLIAMYSGMRREEICQLAPGDVVNIDGIWCFDVNERAGKHLKTAASERIVPIHSALIKLGFVNFVESRKALALHNLWGFESWKYDYGKKFGNWYTRFNRKHVASDPKKCFHSFRHLVANTLKQLGVQESVIAEILGHKNDNITTGRYGKRFAPHILSEALERLDYNVCRNIDQNANLPS